MYHHDDSMLARTRYRSFNRRAYEGTIDIDSNLEEKQENLFETGREREKERVRESHRWGKVHLVLVTIFNCFL